ncbi:MAG: phosphoribosylglycinamide formyltransferase [Bacteroidia bacterium]|nr:phosphoribosylglycinamide formyltransferase [Bacteroidia bacterium]
MSSQLNIAIFASGGGSNARALLRYFQGHPDIRVSLLVSNNPHSGIFEMGPDFGVPTVLLPRHQDGDEIVRTLHTHEVELVVLAGYLKLIPDAVVAAFPRRIINIHPSLLPRYGGKGMYGMRVHEAVILAHEITSGITIHYVNEVYDQGEMIFQAELPVAAGWTPADLQAAVQRLEHQYFPEVVEKICAKLLSEKKIG